MKDWFLPENLKESELRHRDNEHDIDKSNDFGFKEVVIHRCFRGLAKVLPGSSVCPPI